MEERDVQDPRPDEEEVNKEDEDDSEESPESGSNE
jgi:hypothetical protein